MKLSEAILLGSTMNPQAFGVYEDPDGHTCALGAALKAVGFVVHKVLLPMDAMVNSTNLAWLFPFLHYYDACPGCGAANTVFNIIPHLNDDHKWTREQIAEWVATVEPKEEANELDNRKSKGAGGADNQEGTDPTFAERAEANA